MTRSSGLAAYGLLWLSVVWGLFSSTRLARGWPGAGTTFDLHEHLSLLALGFAALHAIVLLLDREFGFSLFELTVPFTARRDRAAIGLGQIALAVLASVTLSHYLRKRIGQRAWRALHYLAFVVYALALTHAALAGTDSASPALRAFYFTTAGVVLFLTTYRVLLAATNSSAAESRDHSARSAPRNAPDAG
jgi:predicted ferric reductase